MVLAVMAVSIPAVVAYIPLPLPSSELTSTSEEEVGLELADITTVLALVIPWVIALLGILYTAESSLLLPQPNSRRIFFAGIGAWIAGTLIGAGLWTPEFDRAVDIGGLFILMAFGANTVLTLLIAMIVSGLAIMVTKKALVSPQLATRLRQILHGVLLFFSIAVPAAFIVIIIDSQQCGTLLHFRQNQALCVAKQALESREPQLCDQFKGSRSRFDKCYQVMAQGLADPLLCAKIVEPRNQDTCYSILASQVSDRSLCDKMGDDGFFRQQCHGVVTRQEGEGFKSIEL